MKPSVTLFACLLVASLVLAGCSGNNSSTTTSKTSPAVVTKTTTVTGTASPPVTVTQTQTTTATPTSDPSTPPTSTSPPSSSSAPSGSNPGGDGADTDYPVISGLGASAITQTSALIEWKVQDEGDVDPVVRSQVEFLKVGQTGNFLQLPLQNGNGPHSETLTSLSSCTSYNYRIHAIDNAQTPHEATSSSATFITDSGGALGITTPTFSEITNTKMTVSWTASGANDMQSYVQYSSSPITTGTPQSATFTGIGAKSVTLTGLNANTIYNIRVHASNNCATGNTKDVDTTQSTAILMHVDIKGNNGPLSFSPGEPLTPANVPANKPIVFEIKNTDSVLHNWNIQGVVPAYGSGNIAAGATHTFTSSVVLSATGGPSSNGSYTMFCSLHSGGTSPMTGTIRAV